MDSLFSFLLILIALKQYLFSIFLCYDLINATSKTTNYFKNTIINKINYV